MKAIRLLIAATLLTTAASANNHAEKDRVSEVYLIVEEESSDPEICEFESAEEMRRHLRNRKECIQESKDYMTLLLAETHRTGFQCTEPPAFIFAQKESKFAFGVGGFVNLRTSYDFNSAVSNIDFVTADIPIPGGYDSRQQLMMDASTSRVYFTGVVNSRAIGPISFYVDMDFRGDTGYGESGVTNSYMPRLRSAYASFLGFTVGRDITTFCDLDSAPETIDFQGPSAYSFNFATLLRYEHTFCYDHLTMGIALEQPSVSGTYDTYFEAIPQRVPDVPVYLQYEFGYERQSHFRASAIFRDMYAYNATTQENTSLFGWGVQASGRINPVRWMGICFNGIYGKGITPYIQDLNGSGLDFTPNPEDNTSLQTMPMYAWQAAANFNISDRLTANGGYSRVVVHQHNGYYTDDQFLSSQYIFGNLFYDITPRLKVACEYLFGSRRNMNDAYNSANRASFMTQFNF